MELTLTERLHFADLAWFQPPSPWAAVQGGEQLALRPLCLATWKAMEIMGLTLLEAEAALSAEEETHQTRLFLWLHTEAIAEVSAALWDGSWCLIGADLPESERILPALLGSFLPYRARLISLLTAARIRVRPRPPSKHDPTPSDVVDPSEFAFIVATLIRETHLPLETLLWDTFLPQALQLYHAALRWNGSWTLPPGQPVDEEAVEDATPDFLKEAYPAADPVISDQ